ncbi:MAG TPA: hypothetical protein VG870_04250 [Chitinophagaceae bacterium]|nr:hypothetical protein [Chitinophagaceae bacterium]
MKKWIVTLLLVTGMVDSYSQGTQLTREALRQKSGNQRTAGWIMLGGGTALAVAGIITFSHSDFLSDGSGTDAGGIMTVGGVLLDLGSIVLFAASSRNARKAARMSFRSQPALLPRPGGLGVRPVPSLTLQVRF